MDLWDAFWTRQFVSLLPGKIVSTLKSCNESMFPNLYCCLRLLGTGPVPACECERSISSLRWRRLKSYMRSTMGEDRVNGLAALHVHKHLPLDLENMMDDFAAMHPRRMMVTTILTE